MTSVPALSRALAALFLAATAVVGAPHPASADGSLPPDAPGVLVVGAAAALGDGKTVLLDGTASGSGVLDFLVPTGTGEAPGWWLVELKGWETGVGAADIPAGWELPVGPAESMSAPFAWAPGAPPVTLEVMAVGPDSVISAATTVVLQPDSRAPVVSKVAASVKSGTFNLTWRESSSVEVMSREVVTESAPAVASGCSAWGPAETVALPNALLSYSSLSTAADSAAASLVTASSNVMPVAADEVVAPQAPIITAAGASGVAQLSFGTPSAGTCYRFTVLLHDELGHVAQATSAVLQTPAAIAAAAPTGPWTGSVDVFRRGAFVSQATPTWCVGASAQMMVNLVSGRSDTRAATQKAIMAWAQANDGLTSGRLVSTRGTDADGWTSALLHFGAGRYKAVGAESFADALHAAAVAIRKTGRPVGLFVMGGRHAWVMTGFSATADPLGRGASSITTVRVSGPLWPSTGDSGYDPAPDTQLSAHDLAKFYSPAFGGADWLLIAPVG